MAWYNTNWTKRFAITSDATKIDEVTDNVYYDLANAPAGFWAAVRSDGGDIRVTRSDGETEIAREVSGFNQGSQVGSLFFDGVGLSISSNVERFIYYGNPSATEPAAASTFGKNAVWASYLCVFHLDESASPISCSKTNNTGTQGGGVGFNATGKLRTACDFAGGDDQIVMDTDVFDLPSASVTISAWVNPDSLTANMNVCCKEDGDNTDGYRIGTDSSSRIRFTIADAAGESSLTSSVVMTTGSLQHIIATYNGSNVNFFRNGVSAGTAAATKVPGNSVEKFTIGSFSGFPSGFGPWIGIIDELRVSTSVRSQNWITTEFNNQNSPSTFWTTGLQQDVPGGISPFITVLGAKRI